jgi:hypothetical protein
MRRVNVDPLLRACPGPAFRNAAAGKDQRVRAALVENGKLEIAIEGRCRNRLPHSRTLGAGPASRFDVNHPHPQPKSAAQAAFSRALIFIKTARAWIAHAGWMRRSPPPRIRNCPICGLAMQASKSEESAAEFDLFECLTCRATIVERPAAAELLPPREKT